MAFDPPSTEKARGFDGVPLGPDAALLQQADEESLSYARGMLERYDRNGNQVLERDELRRARGISGRADENDDGLITMAELALSANNRDDDRDDDRRGDNRGRDRDDDDEDDRRPAFAGRPGADRTARFGGGRQFGRGGPSREDGDEDDEPGDNARGGRFGRGPNAPGGERGLAGFGARAGGAGPVSEEPRSYRLASAQEKLPQGLPGWFTSSDSNGDGQVAMHEYSRTWDSSTVSRFNRIDADGDGIITPAEAAGSR